MEKDMRYYVEISGRKMEENLKGRQELLSELTSLYRQSEKKDICIIASGSSLNGAMAAESFIRKYSGGRTLILSSSEYLDYRREEAGNYFCIAVSQSGCSTNTIQAVKRMREDGVPAIALTGNREGKLKDYAEHLLEYGVGNEAVDYVTLGFSVLMEYLMLFALEAGRLNGRLTDETYQELLEELRMGCQANSEMYRQAEAFTGKYFRKFLEMKKVIIISDGANMAVAREAALKFGETLKIPALYYESEEYIHGPNMQLTPDYAVFFIDFNEKHNRMQEIFAATGLVTDNIYLVTNKEIKVPEQTCICGGSGVSEPAGKKKLTERVCSVKSRIRNEITPLFTAVLFQYIAAVVTKEKNQFRCHPLFEKFEEKIHCKTENYKEIMKAKEEKAKEEKDA